MPMSKRQTILLLGIVLLGGLLAFRGKSNGDKLKLTYPKSWPKPVYDLEKNPLSKTQIALGRKLFYDPILSKDNLISCASCHLSYTAFTHVDHALSHGVGDSIGTRNSIALVNLAWNKHFMWDGAINNIEVQALAPISHPAEMAEDINHVLEKLQQTDHYPEHFSKAFGERTISSQNLLKALAQFQLTFVSCNAKYDRVKAGKEAFSEQEQRGYSLFQAKCASCHAEPLFTTGDFASNGLPMDPVLKDVGRYQVTKRPADSLKFKIPSLRNVEFSQPYMHDGRFTSLHQVLAHYAVWEDYPTAGLAPQNGQVLSANERVDLVAFLLTLTDKEFLFNQELSFPRN